jgi:hypothetical protein
MEMGSVGSIKVVAFSSREKEVVIHVSVSNKSL